MILTTDVTKQYIGFAGDRFDLVRVEDREGKATRNAYYLKLYTCGPSVPEQTASEWEADLLSGDYLSTLRALVWLGGKHRQPDALNPAPREFEPATDIILVREMRSCQNVHTRLRALAGSDNRWLRQAARLALVPADVRVEGPDWK